MSCPRPHSQDAGRSDPRLPWYLSVLPGGWGPAPRAPACILTHMESWVQARLLVTSNSGEVLGRSFRRYST